MWWVIPTSGKYLESTLDRQPANPKIIIAALCNAHAHMQPLIPQNSYTPTVSTQPPQTKFSLLTALTKSLCRSLETAPDNLINPTKIKNSPSKIDSDFNTIEPILAPHKLTSPSFNGKARHYISGYKDRGYGDQYLGDPVAAHLLTHRFLHLPKDVLFKSCQGFGKCCQNFARFVLWDLDWGD